MKDQLHLDFDYEPAAQMGQHCWWRSAVKFDECARLKTEAPTELSKIVTPRVRVLRELERLALVAPEGLDELRHKLLAYRCGDLWVPTGGIKKEEMDIPATNTILLVGFHNAGKSSLINLMYSVLGRSGLIPFAQTATGSTRSRTTQFMEEHNVLRSMRSGFCVYDTRGFDYNRPVQDSVQELSEWVADGVRHQQPCFRPGKNGLTEEEEPEGPLFSKFAKRRVNCVMMVANVWEIWNALKAGDKKPLEATKELFCSPALRKHNESPILILTHGDKLSTEDRIESRLRICEHLGISEATGAYDIVCLTEYGFLADESDPVTAYALAEAVYRGLLVADRSHLPKKGFYDWTLLCLSWLLRFLGGFFAFLAHVFSTLGGTHNLKR
ncbi:hypothetical protein NMG60_11013780 [Bertholletia excelsa]